MTLTYKEQLLNPNWQRKRLEKLTEADWQCESCGGAETTLHVHHKRYVKGRMAWEYEADQLAVLCATCHAGEHANRELLDRLLAESELGCATTLALAIGLLSGYLDGACAIHPETSKEGRQLDGESYHAGILASMAPVSWPKMAEAAKILTEGSLTPAQEHALSLWSGDA